MALVVKMRCSNKVVVCSLLAAILSGSCSMGTAGAAISNYSFPDNFLFGVASAAYQIEGAWNLDGKGESIWDAYTHEHPEYTPDHSNGDVACDSYHLWQRDVQMVKELGVGYYRFSISWPRILPEGTDNRINVPGVLYYKNLINALLEEGITPMITLYHWDLPSIFMDLGGWANPIVADYFEDYARVAFSLFGDKVKYWITMNEPHQHCTQGYGATYFAPALNSHGIGEYLCVHHMLLAHARAYRLYEKDFKPKQNGTVGITLDAFWAEPKNASSKADLLASDRYLQMHLGMYAHPIYSNEGDYPAEVRKRIDHMSDHQGFSQSRLPRFTKDEIEALRGSSDFFGLNHYTSFAMSFADSHDQWPEPSLDHDTGVNIEQKPEWPKTNAVWLTVYPPGFRKLLNWITREYGRKVPILITENGMADAGGIKDYQRVSYYNEYMNQILLAMNEDNCNIMGYIAWTLMDDFEWKSGYVDKFGLYHVDFESPQKTRTPKLSAFNYREIVRTKQVNFDYIRQPSQHDYYDFSHNRID